MVGGRVLGGEGVWPGYVVAHPASPLGPLSHQRPRHAHPFSPTNLVSSKTGVFFLNIAKIGYLKKIQPCRTVTLKKYDHVKRLP